jgi:hypothetical protein
MVVPRMRDTELENRTTNFALGRRIVARPCVVHNYGIFHYPVLCKHFIVTIFIVDYTRMIDIEDSLGWRGRLRTFGISPMPIITVSALAMRKGVLRLASCYHRPTSLLLLSCMELLWGCVGSYYVSSSQKSRLCLTGNIKIKAVIHRSPPPPHRLAPFAAFACFPLSQQQRASCSNTPNFLISNSISHVPSRTVANAPALPPSILTIIQPPPQRSQRVAIHDGMAVPMKPSLTTTTKPSKDGVPMKTVSLLAAAAVLVLLFVLIVAVLLQGHLAVVVVNEATSTAAAVVPMLSGGMHVKEAALLQQAEGALQHKQQQPTKLLGRVPSILGKIDLKSNLLLEIGTLVVCQAIGGGVLPLKLLAAAPLLRRAKVLVLRVLLRLKKHPPIRHVQVIVIKTATARVWKGAVAVYSKTSASKLVNRSKRYLKVFLKHRHHPDDDDNNNTNDEQ